MKTLERKKLTMSSTINPTFTTVSSVFTMVKPPDPLMSTCEETYAGSPSFYLVFGGKAKADWIGIEDLSSRRMSDL